MGTCGHICVNARVLLLLSTPSRTNSVGSATELEVAAKRNYSSTNSGNIFFFAHARSYVHAMRIPCASAHVHQRTRTGVLIVFSLFSVLFFFWFQFFGSSILHK